MQPLDTAPKKHHDPAPSRIAYRLQRLWLTPVLRKILKVGVPVFMIVALAGWYFSNPARLDNVRQRVATTRYNIEHLPEFMVNLMRIDNVSTEVAEDIREVTAVDFPVSSFDLDLEAMRARIEGLDAVASVDLAIKSGGVLDVTVVERVPAIVWRGRDLLELLDATGHRVGAAKQRSDHPDLSLIAGDGADKAVPEALDLFKAASPIKARMRGLLRVGERRWDVILDRGQRIMLPEKNPVMALERALALNEMDDLLNRDLVAVDLRDARRPTLRLGRQAFDFLHKAAFKSDGENP